MEHHKVICIPYQNGLFHMLAVAFAEYGFFHALKSDVGKKRADHPSYNVAKKVLEFEFTAEIPRIHLRASYGDGFKGAPLTCEGSLTRNPGELDDQAAKKEVHALGGPRHV